MITRAQALSIMEAREQQGNPLPFSLQFCSVQTGELKQWLNIILAKNKKQLPKYVKGGNTAMNRRRDMPELIKVYFMETGEIKSVHMQLITHINNLQIAP
jgi:hypothetical protein